MSGGDYRNRPSFQIPGKEFLIVIVVIFSSLSFTLGYFVGKSGKNSGTAPPVPVTETVSPRKSADTDVRPQAETPAGEDRPAAGEAGPDTPMKGEAPPPLPARKPAPYPLSSGNYGTGNAGNEVAARPSSSKGKLQKGTISYTVQIGAFSTEKDAEDLREKYEKKRYKAYIVPGENKKGETIYKIRIGEFKNRKDAELLSLKLKKTEELNTFVTFKGE